MSYLHSSQLLCKIREANLRQIWYFTSTLIALIFFQQLLWNAYTENLKANMYKATFCELSSVWERYNLSLIPTFSSSWLSCSSNLWLWAGGSVDRFRDSDCLSLSPMAPWIRSSVVFRTFRTSVVILQSDEAVYFYTGTCTGSHTYTEA